MAQETHSFMGDEIISQHLIKEHNILVYGCFDKGTPIGEYDFYDVYIEISGGTFCMNEGDPFDEVPTQSELEDLTQSYLESIDI
jgi:hypothetical protein